MRFPLLTATLLGSSASFAHASFANVLPRQDSSTDTESSTVISSNTESVSSTASVLTTATPSATSSITAGPSDTVSSTPTASAAPSDTVSSTTIASAAPSAPSNGDSSLLCNTDDAKASGFSPFCRPTNGSVKTVGNTYPVTWDPSAFENGDMITINMNIANDSSIIAWYSNSTASNVGFVYLDVTEDLLKGNPQQWLNVSLFVAPKNGDRYVEQGPLISIVPVPPPAAPAPPPPTSFNKLGLAIGLPLALAVVILVIAVGLYRMRKDRFGLGKIKLGRRKGYGVGKSRRQRMGDSGEHEFDAAEPIYRDNPEEFEQKYQDSTRNDRSTFGQSAFASARALLDSKLPHSLASGEELSKSRENAFK